MPLHTSAVQQVSLIPVLSDNYVFVLHGDPGGAAAVVDPAVADPVIAWLEARDLHLAAILHTHHHHDHIGGTPALLQRWPAAAVIASAADRARIPFQTQGVAGGDRFTLLGREVQVLAVPGHTAHHIAYYLPAVAGRDELFCGDTLFAGGCGRLFEGTPTEMHRSLQQLAALPEATRVWGAHEYTEANLRWAAAVEPGLKAVVERLAQVQQQRAAGQPTIPSSIGLEKATNLFLQAANADQLRQRRGSKDLWRG
ncbi:hydroxyacylglutathione hydrolase [Synechococcus sp. JJ3a-Johnson]|uniref:hydroxyacylglutathione hydrolase n=1 Tax=Synechococcus sp. JJ3a-Johnson TaxID=2823738 RepID=UPI0020CFBE7F|nr:hydroxyacylglutathione hydrolase [Synechococcus sp. JJ3a-Johnson]MCP9831417.1 hydroxyacylglutathione hydrolase [Synechococcus sp. JJ3a-Johnson]